MDLESRGICIIYIVKKEALICVFVSAYAKSRCSHDMAQIRTNWLCIREIHVPLKDVDRIVNSETLNEQFDISVQKLRIMMTLSRKLNTMQ